jgi:hypothetical protein
VSGSSEISPSVNALLILVRCALRPWHAGILLTGRHRYLLSASSRAWYTHHS